MTEIPEDVMKAAYDAALSYRYDKATDPIHHDGALQECIARAILAERERCEKRNRRGPCEHVWVGKPGPKIFGFREFNCIKCGLGKQEK